jgi:hypothetical protein
MKVIVPHCAGAVPILADRINEFMRLFLPGDSSPDLDAVQQLRGLYYDMAGTAFPRQIPALLNCTCPREYREAPGQGRSSALMARRSSMAW